jgi:hypothetical protein
MPLPPPAPGLVLSYDFLWHKDHLRGGEDGDKVRPCPIILVIETEKKQKKVLVCHITHSEPRAGDIAIEIPPKVRANLGLDDKRQWIIANELNEFVWPGVDLYPVPRGRPDQYDYGHIPPALFEQLRKAVLEHYAVLKRTARTE